ncbi:MAG: leucine-rich repeat domain-containing protein [Clostridia bacterium]|nr:leucine-rich repeat domain-containing protein [Clostridia bacterium]
MRKIRLLALLLVILMVSSAFVLAACDNTEEEDKCAEGEHEWRHEQNPQKREIIQELTCTDPEIRERECKKCGFKEQYESQPPSGHRYNSTLKVYLHDATCTEDGHTIVRCENYDTCGDEMKEVLRGSSLGHEYVNYVSTADGYSAIAKCVRCDSTSEKLLGLKLDMEGDRSHLSYQRLELYKGNVQNAAEFKTVTVGDKSNTYVSITRPEEYTGDSKLGVKLSPEGSVVYGKSYIFEARYIIDEENTGDLVMFEGAKASMNQSMIFLTYDSEAKTICTRDGAVYKLGADDFANGVKVSLKLNDRDMLYEVFVNDKLVTSAPVRYADNYFTGILLAGINIYMSDSGASTFGIDDIYFYAGAYPNGFDNKAENNTNFTYGVHTFTVSGSNETYNISYRLPVETATHTESDHDFTSNVVTYNPDCVLNGYTIATCPGCGGQKISNVVPNKGHRWDEGVSVPATCYEAGYNVYTCQDCGIRNGEQTEPVLEHVHGEDATVFEPTCTSDGYATGPCAHCGIVFTIIDEDSKTDHQLGDDVVKTQVTCVQQGCVSGKCRFCGEDYVDPYSIIPPYGHYSFGDTFVERLPANCTDDGYDRAKCVCCGEVYDAKVYPKTGHKLYSYIESNGVVTKCRDCSYTETDYIYPDKEYPNYEDMVEKIGESNLLKTTYADSSVLSSGVVLRQGAIEHPSGSDGTKYGRITMIPSAAIAEGTNTHAYIDWGAVTDHGKTVVFELDAKFPTQLSSDQTCGGFNANGYISGSEVYALFSIETDGSIKVGNAVVGNITSLEWTRIAVVSDLANCVNVIYVNGKKVATNPFAGWKYDYIKAVRLNFTRHDDKTTVIDIDNMYMYYSDMPVYITEAPELNVDIKNIKPSNITSADMVTTAGFEDYVQKIGGANFNHKSNAKLSLYDKNNDSVNDAFRYQYNANIPSVSTNGGNSYIQHEGFTNGGTYTFHTNITFTEVTGKIGIFKGRVENGGPNGSQTVEFPFLHYEYVGIEDGTNKPYGVIKTEDGGVLRRVYANETLDFYVVDNETAKTYDIYIDGEMVLDSYDYSYHDYAYPSSKLTYKILSQEGAAGNNIDILINEIDYFADYVTPSNYSGKTVGDKVVDGDINVVVKFDGTEKIAHLMSGNGIRVLGSTIANGYYYTEIEHSYLSLEKAPADALAEGNLRYVMIDPMGDEVTEGGIWVLSSNDHKTNGAKNIAFFDLNGAPINSNGNYDLTGYSEVVFRVYVKNKTQNGYNIQVNANNADDSVINGPVDNYSTGWHEISMPVNAGWNNIESLELMFSGMTTGAHTDTSCTDENCTNVEHFAPVDGLTVYLESITLVKADITLENTGYAVEGSPCAEHTFGEATVVEAVGCDGIGYTYKVCSECGYKEVTVVRGQGHTLELVATECVPANCDTNGKNVYKCTNEGCDYKTKEVTDALLHNYVRKDDATAEDGYVAATCTEGGVDVYVCVNENCSGYTCGESHSYNKFLVNTAPLGHKHDASATVTEADCYNDRYSVGECVVCHENVKITYEGTKLEHSMVTINTPADCVNDGSIVVKCDREGCDYVKSETVLPALGHDMPADYIVIFVDKSCTSYKGVQYNCRVCGEFVEEYEVELGKEPHVWGEFTIVEEETCGKNGHREAICQVCGAKKSVVGSEAEKQECVIPATGGHTYSEEYFYTNAADKTIEGIRYIPCTVCGQPKPDTTEKVPAIYEGTQGLEFTYNNNGAYVITGYEGNATEIVIPSTYSGKPVILGRVFADTDITSVVIPAGVKVADGAFRDCDKLVNVTLPADMTVLPAEIFYGCTALESIKLPENCAVISNGAFFGCKKLTTITINAVLTEVQQFAFSGTALTTVNYVSTVCPEVIISANGNDKLIKAKWIAE